jgi:DNA-binding response OmpR family regulator
MPHHILVVDDEPEILEILARLLRARGIRVSTARRASVARIIMMHEGVDLLIADARIPGENGIDLARAAEELGIPALVMSGDAAWALAHGAAPGQLLSKPFEIEHMLRRVAGELG